MFKIFAIVFLLVIFGNCQLLRDEERPTRYILPYSGLSGSEEPEIAEEKHYYKPTRRAERIPATAYQYDETEEEYYRPQPPQSRQKVEAETYRYQPTTPSHKDYEEILKNNHLARLRVAAKKQQQPLQSQTQTQSQAQAQAQAQQPVEQYLKEVNPTTKTTYQRPPNYLRYKGQQDHGEETPLKPQPYRYILQPELQQQKPYHQYQFETQQESVKPAPPKTPHFNLVAYQNALIAQQKLLAAENQEEGPSKSAIYVSQNVKKAKKQKPTPPRPSTTQQYDYYPQVPPQRPTYSPPLTPRNAYPKNDNYQIEDSLLYPEKEIEYQTQPPVRPPKQRTTRLPRRKPKYQTEEPQDEYQPSGSKYPADDQTYDYQPKYQDEPAYRRPLPRPTKPSKYEDQGDKDDYVYQPIPKYQRENLPRRQQSHYPPEDVRPTRYLSRQQYQDESKQLPQYQAADLAYQPTAEVAVRQSGRGPSVSYRQTYPQYQYDSRQQFITPVQPKTRHFNSVEYQNALIAEQEEDSSIYVSNNPLHLKTQKIYPSTQYKHHTASQRQTNTIKLAPIVYQPSEKNDYEVEELTEDIEPEEAAATYNYSPAPVLNYQQIEESTAPTKFNPNNVTKKKGFHYPRRTKKRPTYLNGQMFREEVQPPRRIQIIEDLATQSTSKAVVRYDTTQPFLILVYDE